MDILSLIVNFGGNGLLNGLAIESPALVHRTKEYPDKPEGKVHLLQFGSGKYLANCQEVSMACLS